jgi:myo-inositol-1(or 4)-monophosphatase
VATAETGPGDPSYPDLLRLAHEVAREAATLVRNRTGQAGAVATKSSPTDVVTEADRAAEDLIRRRLLAERPRDGFVGEESDARESSTGVTWVVDPIDGTVNFLYGIPQFSVSIAATVDDQPVAGVVLNVVTGECFTAYRGGGAWCDGRRLRVNDPVPLGQCLVVTGFSYEREIRVQQAAAVAQLLGSVRDVRRLGSAALDLCFLAAGRCDAYVEEGLNAWDMAAGGLVAVEAGARIGTRPGVGGGTCVVAAPAEAHEAVLALVADCGFLREQNSSPGR